MSGYLWKYYLEHDVENFRRVLLESGYTTRAGGGGTAIQKSQIGGGRSDSNVGLSIGSPGSFGTSPTLVVKNNNRREGDGSGNAALMLTRNDINHRDSSGRTLLHLAASSNAENAFDFASALLEHPLTDIYVQDNENAWTALHRAFYVGNLAIAHSIIQRDMKDALGHGSGQFHQLTGGLVKIKDSEGNGPFDLLEMTLEDDVNRGKTRSRDLASSDSDNDSMPGMDDDEGARLGSIQYNNLAGSEIFTFGSNQNVTLGFGDEDDRHNPERITLRRPDQLYFQAYKEYLKAASTGWTSGDVPGSSILQSAFVSDLPSVIRNKPMRIQEVHMAKLHSAVLTDDSESNLHMCGHGKGGRLGLGDERTRFQFVCVDGGAIANKKIADVALGQNHTVALSDQGEVFAWGSNDCGQLGYDLPKGPNGKDDPIQLTPRRIFGPLKRETIIGIAASRIHSVAYTDTALYTWGKNEGQLGIVHSESRSTKIQSIPRNVAASRFSSTINSVSAIDRATTILLDNYEVMVFAHYIYIKVDFPLHGFDNYFLKSSFMTTNYDRTPNRICKVVSAGDTIAAMSSSGQVWSITVSEPPALQDSEASSTNPKIGTRNALSQPIKAWSNKKSHLSARDVDVDQNGSIILVTAAGSVWRRVKRAKIKDATSANVGENKPKDYKYSRIPGLTRITAVRASGFGAYAAVREDTHYTRVETSISPSTLLSDVWPLVPFQTLYPSDTDSPAFPKKDLIDLVMKSADPDEDIRSILQPRDAAVLPYDLLLCSTTSDIEIPVHQFIASARSKIIRTALAELSLFEQFSLPETFTLLRSDDGQVRLKFQAADILTLFNLALYFYTDSLAPVWSVSASGTKQKMAFRYRQVRMELQKFAGKLEMSYLESALKRIVLPAYTLHRDMESAYADSSFFENADVVVTLADSEEAWIHGALVVQRCPFFEGLFKGRTGGMWLSDRRSRLENPEDAIRVDLSNISHDVFDKVLRHIYAGTGTELFDEVVADGLDEFLDEVIDVMSAANELMLDRLSEVCQQVVGNYVGTRNVVQLLNAVSPCSVTAFKAKALEYICYNLEAIMRHGHLDELDEDLWIDLDETANRLQIDCSVMSRTRQQEASIAQKYPDLERRIELEKQAKIDSIILFNKYGDVDVRAPSSYRAGSFHDAESVARPTPSRRRSSTTAHTPQSPSLTPILKGKASAADLMFDMDDEDEDDIGTPVTSFQHKLAGAMSSGTSTPRQADRPLPAPLPTDRPAGPSPKEPGRPWGASPLASSKLDMKQIMDQAASSRTSNLTMGLASTASPVANRSISGSERTMKISQKERKRQQMLEGAQTNDVPVLVSPVQSSPWQTAGSKGKQIPSRTVSASPVRSSPSAVSVPKAPQLTMRQTVANPTSLGNDKGAWSGQSVVSPTSCAPSGLIPQKEQAQTKAADRPTSSRGASTPKKHVPTPDPNAPGFAISDKPIAVQSVRHTPKPDRSLSGSQRNIIDILSEQEIQKQEIKDFAAARSLMDIQQEQEFQEWWDKETARVREEEEAASAKKPSAGRGRGRKRGRGGANADGNPHTDRKDSSSMQTNASGEEKRPPSKVSGERGRPNRGRGRGRGQEAARGSRGSAQSSSAPRGPPSAPAPSGNTLTTQK